MTKPRGRFLPSPRKIVAVLATTTIVAAGAVKVPAADAVDGTTAAPRAGAVSARWPGSTMVRSTAHAVTGTVLGLPQTVYLQRRVPGSWTSVASSRTTLLGTYRLQIPTDVMGTFRFRVLARPVLGTTWASDQSALLTVRPSWRPLGSSTDHRTMAGDARWNPCETISYRVNASQASPGAVTAVRTALAQITQASGLRFAYLGPTSLVPRRSSYEYGSGTEMVIAWARPSQTDVLRDGRGTLGMGGPVFFDSGYEDGAGQPSGLIVKGYVVMNADYNARTGSGTGPTSMRVGTLKHELGHVLGIGHAAGSSQVMYGQAAEDRDNWGAGDLEGLRRAGFTGGCLKPASSTRQSARSTEGTAPDAASRGPLSSVALP